MKFVRTVAVAKPLDRVFTYLSDFRTTEEWDPASVRTERVSGGGGVGTEYHNVSRFMGREAELRYVVTELDPDRRFALRGENKSLVAHDVMSLAGDSDRTTVTYAATFELKGLSRLAAPLLAPALKRLVDRGAEGLERALQRL
jgi:carbon monoxide dehydrogenase subunit G